MAAKLEPPLAPDMLDRLGLLPGQTVADFGAGGAANWSVELSRIVGPDGRVLLFDVRKGALAAALNTSRIRGSRNCYGVWSNLEIYRGAHGVSDRSIDGGVAVTLLNETKNVKDVLAEIHRMLKIGARLLVIDWKPEAQHRLAPPPERRLAQDYATKVAGQVDLATLEKFSPSRSYWGTLFVST